MLCTLPIAAFHINHSYLNCLSDNTNNICVISESVSDDCFVSSDPAFSHLLVCLVKLDMLLSNRCWYIQVFSAKIHVNLARSWAVSCSKKYQRLQIYPMSLFLVWGLPFVLVLREHVCLVPFKGVIHRYYACNMLVCGIGYERQRTL